MRSRILSVLVAASIMVCLSGCGRQDIYPVKGKLIYSDGTPAAELKGSRVIFEGSGPDGRNYSAEGEIDGNGHFVLTTTKEGDGAVIGKNRVLIERRMIDPEHPAPRVIHERFERFESSGIELEVEKKKNEFTITVERVEAK